MLFSCFSCIIIVQEGKCRSTMELDQNYMLIRADVNGEEIRIGEGGSSIVYKAVSTYGRSIAIKSPKNLASETKLEEKILPKTSSHPNIISLLGYAEDGIRGRCLVFEFMGRGSLRWNLKERGETLDWERRLAIALQISSAIQILHMYLTPPIYHGNGTSENILLDEYYNAKLGGFGSANYCMNEDGMKDSEMAVDIRSFGLLLAELLKGEPISEGDGCEFFGSFEEINEVVWDGEWLDPRVGIPEEEWKMMGLAKLGEIAKWCICGAGGEQRSVEEGDENFSPKIGGVVSGLKQLKQLFCSVQANI